MVIFRPMVCRNSLDLLLKCVVPYRQTRFLIYTPDLITRCGSDTKFENFGQNLIVGHHLMGPDF
jgi:hypothetical protein